MVTNISSVKTKFTSSPEMLKNLLDKYDSVIVEVNSTVNDLTKTCMIGDTLIVKPDRMKIMMTKTYIVGIGDRLIFCRLKKEARKKDTLTVMGMGEVAVSDIVIWCNARRASPTYRRR